MLFSSLSWLLLSPLFIDFFLTLQVFGPAPDCSLSPAYWKRRVILPPERSWNLLQPKPDGCVHGAVHHSCSPPYDVRKSGSLCCAGAPLLLLHAKTRAPRLGGSSCVTSQVLSGGGKKRFLYLDAETRVSSEHFRGADLERTQSLLAEQLRGIGWSRVGPFFLVQIYSLWNSAGLVTWGRVTGRRPKMDRRNRDEAVQAAHSHFYKFEETARTPGVISYS